MIRASAYAWSVSLHTYQSRFGLRRDERDSTNQGCWSDVWLIDQLGDHPQASPMRLAHEGPEVAQRAVVGMDPPEIGDVVAVVPER